MHHLDWYEWKAGQFEKKIAKYFDFANEVNCKILEIGSGPIGIVSFLNWGQRYAVDPLEGFYRTKNELIHLRNGRVRYLSGQAENLPFEDNQFSIAIIDNVIDHTQSPKRVLQEISRVLKQGCMMFFTVNIHTKWGVLLHSMIQLLQLDKGHPHSFSYKSIRELLNSHGFAIAYEELEDYGQIKKRNCHSKHLKDKLKGYSGISDILYTSVCRKISIS